MPGDIKYSSKRHRDWREKVLRSAHYLCERCARYGRRDENGMPIRATIAHHKQPAEQFPALRYLVSNGEALCAACHNIEHPEKGRRKGYPPR